MEAKTKSKKPLVLCVDDERDLCAYLAEEIEYAGFDTIKAYDGMEALKILSEQVVDAVVTDIQMPGRNGFELLQEAKALNPSRPIILFITGYSEHSELDVYDAGAEAIFSKPVDFDALIGKLKQLIQPVADRYRAKVLDSNLPKIHSKVKNLDLGSQSSDFVLGRGGFFLAMNKSELPWVDQHAEVHLENMASQESLFHAEAICRWRRTQSDKNGRRGAGFEIIRLDEKSLQLFENYLEKGLPRAYIPRG